MGEVFDKSRYVRDGKHFNALARPDEVTLKQLAASSSRRQEVAVTFVDEVSELLVRGRAINAPWSKKGRPDLQTISQYVQSSLTTVTYTIRDCNRGNLINISLNHSARGPSYSSA